MKEREGTGDERANIGNGMEEERGGVVGGGRVCAGSVREREMDGQEPDAQSGCGGACVQAR